MYLCELIERLAHLILNELVTSTVLTDAFGLVRASRVHVYGWGKRKGILDS